MAERFVRLWQPDLVVSSDARRCLDTLSFFLPKLALPSSRVVYSPACYEAPLASLAEVVRNYSGDCAHLLLVGHNPGLELLAEWLSGERIRLPTCALLTLNVSHVSWSLTQVAGSADILHLDIPLRKAAQTEN